jgi:hypothetical protein
VQVGKDPSFSSLVRLTSPRGQFDVIAEVLARMMQAMKTIADDSIVQGQAMAENTTAQGSGVVAWVLLPTNGRVGVRPYAELSLAHTVSSP